MAKKRNGDYIKLCEAIQIDFGRRVQACRERSGLLQKNLAFRMSLTRANVSNIERGLQRVYLDQVYQVAHLLRVDVTELLPSVEEVFGRPAIHTVADGTPSVLPKPPTRQG
jgi:transcriptional regulator with XRE-family HTH domain